jgi:Helix-turn-helix domain
MIDLNVLKENPELAKSVRFEISGADLLAFGESIHKNAIIESEKNSPKDEVYLTPAQFAESLQVSLVTLWSWDKKGITKPLRIGNAKRYRRSDLEKILCNA